MLALDFAKRVTQRVEEILVRGDDSTVQIELDDSLCPANGRGLSGLLQADQFCCRDISRELDDFGDLSVVQDRIVRPLDPDLPAAFADAFIFRSLVFTSVQCSPEFAVGGAVARRRFDEHAVMLALYLAKRITQRFQEILVRGNNAAVQIELDDSLRPADRGGCRRCVECSCATSQLEHRRKPFCCQGQIELLRVTE